MCFRRKDQNPKKCPIPTVVKSLCNNAEVVKLINSYGHDISYDLIEEIKTDHALMVINEQKGKKLFFQLKLSRLLTAIVLA